MNTERTPDMFSSLRIKRNSSNVSRKVLLSRSIGQASLIGTFNLNMWKIISNNQAESMTEYSDKPHRISLSKGEQAIRRVACSITKTRSQNFPKQKLHSGFLLSYQPRCNQTLISTALDQSKNEEQQKQKTGKRAYTAPKQPEPKTPQPHPLKQQDHGKTFLFHVDDSDSAYKKYADAQTFQPLYKQLTSKQQRERDFVQNNFGGSKQRSNTPQNRTNTPTQKKPSTPTNNQQQWRKQDFLQSSEVLSKALSQNYEQWKQQQRDSPPPKKERKMSLQPKQVKIHRTDLMPADFSWATFDSIKNFKDVDQGHKMPPSLQRNMSLPPEPAKTKTIPSQPKVSPKQVKRSPIKQVQISPQRSPQIKHREIEVEVVNLDLKGINSDKQVENIQRLCNQKGFHVVHCRTDYNKLNNQLTGDSQLLLRRSYNKDQSPKFDSLKNEIQKRGITISEKENKLGYVDIVPNQYIKQTQMHQQDKSELMKKQVNRLYQNYYRFQKSKQN